MTEPGGRWLEFSVAADAESVEAVSDLFSRVGYNEGVVIEEPYRQEEDGEEFRVDQTRPVIVRTFVPINEHTDEARRVLTEGVWHLRQVGTVGELQEQVRAEEDWAESWKQHFPVLELGEHFIVRPTWRKYTPRPGDVVINLDPGMAFGTGSHPSTELAMLLMEQLDFADKYVLDAGAGSGILSIGASLLGAASVDAVEIDQYAAKALHHNVELNGLSDRVATHAGPISSTIPTDANYDIIIANIIARILIENVDALTDASGQDTALILSGIINERDQITREAYEQRGWEVVERREIGDWVAYLMRRVDAP